MLGGICIAVYMLLHPFGGVAGADVARTDAWLIAHTFHLVGAILTLFGLLGVYVYQVRESGRLGVIGFVLASIGTAMFVGTGLITAYLWTAIARHAPSFVAADGPMFTDPLAIGVLSGTYLFLVVGYVTFGIATLRSGLFPRWASLLVIVGIVLFNAPVQPVGPLPWATRVLGAQVLGAGFVGLGFTLWSGRRAAGQRGALLGATG